MGGNTGNFRTYRSQTGVSGSRTIGSILVSDAGNGAGSARRIYSWYAKQGKSSDFYSQVLKIQSGQQNNYLAGMYPGK